MGNSTQHHISQIYDIIVAAARSPRFYQEWGVPDTALGRFEMLTIHMHLLLFRIRGRNGTLDALGQDLVDAFFQDIDHSLRELGIGDMGVPKRMKTLATMFYGRVRAYDDPLHTDDVQSLAAALSRNLFPNRDSWPQGEEMARYMIETKHFLSNWQDQKILHGDVAFA